MGGLLFRRVLAASARRYAAAGWPVAAGAWWDGARYRCPAEPCRIAGHHSAGHGAPAANCSRDAAEITGWWAVYPHTLILPTGLGVDVLDVAGALGLAAWQQLSYGGLRVPAARLPTGRLLLFVAAGHDATADLPAEFPAGAGLVYHRRGSYVIAPPSRLQHGQISWIRAPWVDGWTPPDPRPVLEAIAAVAGVDITHAADAGPLRPGRRQR
jgi:hypothetical protein